jgi:uncharacterized membrane protein
MSISEQAGVAVASRHDPVVRKIKAVEIWEVLQKGTSDFWAMPTHLFFLTLIYPVVGLMLARLIFGYDVLPLLFPIMAGFALVGPIAALGLYEISRRRELGFEPDWKDAFAVFRSPSLPAIVVLVLLLLAIFVAWIVTANTIYVATFGDAPVSTVPSFFDQVFNTPAGWRLILIGNGVGFLFALFVLTISVVSFPLLLDRRVGAFVAIRTSVRAVAANPVAMALWGLTVAVLLAIGSLPLFVGLAIVIPILGHATWHLYRKAVAS